MKFFNDNRTSFAWAACFVFIAALIGVELAYFLNVDSPARSFAGKFWLISSLILLLAAWIYAVTPFFDRAFWQLPHRAWYLIAFFLPPALMLVDAGGTTFTTIDGEGAGQILDAMFFLNGKDSLGIYRIAYYTYPARQYLLTALPTYLFGPSLWALRLGNSWFYIGSYLFFLSSLQNFLRRRQASDALLLTGYAGMMISLGGYALIMTRKFDQGMMPSGVMLFFLAALLLLLIKATPLRTAWIAWAFGFFPFCYTPALGGWVLALGTLLYAVFRWQYRLLLLPILYGIISFYISHLMSHSEPGSAHKFDFGSNDFTLGDWMWRYLYGFRALVNDEYSLIPPPLTLGVLAVLFLCWRQREYRFPLVCLWCAAITAGSLAFFGSAMRSPAYDVQRALIILPPLTLGVVLVLKTYLTEISSLPAVKETVKGALCLCMIYIIYTSISVPFMVRAYFDVNYMKDSEEAFAEVNSLISSHPAEWPKRIYLVPPLDFQTEPVMHYLLPDVVIIKGTPPAGEKIPGTYIFSYRPGNRHDDWFDENMPSKTPRPRLQLEKE